MVGGYSEPLDSHLLTSDEVMEVADFALSEFLLAIASSSEGGVSDAFSNLVEATINAGGMKDYVHVGVLEARRQVR